MHVLGCKLQKKKGARWCYHHNSFWEAMRTRALAAEEGQFEQFMAVMSNEQVAVDEMELYEAEHIGTKQTSKRKAVHWARFNTRHSIVMTSSHTKRTRPYEKEQLCIKMVTEFGRLRPEAEQMWNEHEASNAKRTNDGYKSQMRLWLFLDEFDDKTKAKSMAMEVEQGGDTVKNASAATVDGMLGHLTHKEGGSDWSGNHEFFRGESSLAQQEQLRNKQSKLSTLLGPGAGPDINSALPGAKAPGASEKTEETKRKSSALEDVTDAELRLAAGPSKKRKQNVLQAKQDLYKAINKTGETLASSLASTIEDAKKAMTEHTDDPVDANDKAIICSYILIYTYIYI